MGEGVPEHLQTVPELLDGPHDDRVFVEILHTNLELLIDLVRDIVLEVEAAHRCTLSLSYLLLVIYQTHPQLLSEVLLAIQGRELGLPRHLNVALLELYILAHHYAYQVRLLDLLGHRGQLKEYLLRLLLNQCLFLLYLLLQLVLFRFELPLRLNLRLLYLLLNLDKFVLQLMYFAFIHFIGSLLCRLQLLLLQLLLRLLLNILDALLFKFELLLELFLLLHKILNLPLLLPLQLLNILLVLLLQLLLLSIQRHLLIPQLLVYLFSSLELVNQGRLLVRLVEVHCVCHVLVYMVLSILLLRAYQFLIFCPDALLLKSLEHKFFDLAFV